MSTFTDELVLCCRTEFSRWDNGAGKEYQDIASGASKDFYLFVKEYWVSIGNNNLTGKTTIVNSKTGKSIRPAWSSAFVSFCMRKAGAGQNFFYTEAHCHYIAKAMVAAGTPGSSYGYFARKPDAYAPKVGDVICGGREYAKQFDFAQAALIYEADSFYPSHGDIVVEISGDHVKTIGGNINDNVDMKRLKIDAAGRLRPRKDAKGNEFPWIAVLECRL